MALSRKPKAESVAEARERELLQAEERRRGRWRGREWAEASERRTPGWGKLTLSLTRGEGEGEALSDVRIRLGESFRTVDLSLSSVGEWGLEGCLTELIRRPLRVSTLDDEGSEAVGLCPPSLASPVRAAAGIPSSQLEHSMQYEPAQWQVGWGGEGEWSEVGVVEVDKHGGGERRAMSCAYVMYVRTLE